MGAMGGKRDIVIGVNVGLVRKHLCKRPDLTVERRDRRGNLAPHAGGRRCIKSITRQRGLEGRKGKQCVAEEGPGAAPSGLEAAN